MVVTSIEERGAPRKGGALKQCFLPSIATMSLGKPGVHSLTKKLEAASLSGFQGVELFWDDLEAYAQTLQGESDTSSTPDGIPHVVMASQRIRQLCDQLGLSVVSVQPFRNFDGLIDQEVRKQRLDEFKIWLLVARELAAEFIGVPATIQANAETHTGDLNVIARDLTDLMELARPYKIRIAYENLCFGAHTQSWLQAWEAVARTGKSSEIGFLVDTFNICGDEFADPSDPCGMKPKGEKRLNESLARLVETIPSRSISFLQVADGEFMSPRLTEGHPWMADCQNPKMAWSRNARLFPFEKGGYLPILSVIDAVTRTGWSGWVSMEVFSRSTAVDGDRTIWQHAERAWTSWKRLATAMQWPMRPNSSLGRHQLMMKDTMLKPWTP